MMRSLFRVAALFFVAAAVMHAVAIARADPVDDSPPWRHAVFVAVNLAVAAGLVVRPRGFALAFAVLTGQQLWSHGGAAIRAWQQGRIDWASIVVVVAMPIVLGLLVRGAQLSKSS